MTSSVRWRRVGAIPTGGGLVGLLPRVLLTEQHTSHIKANRFGKQEKNMAVSCVLLLTKMPGVLFRSLGLPSLDEDFVNN